MEDLIQILKALWPSIKAHPYFSTLILLILLYILFLGLRWYASRRLGYRAFFKRVRDLDPSEFIGKYQEYYYHRTADDNIKRRLDNKTPLLITGMPMAGKTRAAYEAIKRFPDYYILYPYLPGLKDLDLSDYWLWPLFRNGLYPWRGIKVILLLNDLPEYTKGISPREGTDRLLALINSLKGLADSFIIVATSRSQEAEELRRDARDFLETFKEVELGTISPSERQKIEKKVKDSSGEFDGTIGSILLGKERMKACLMRRGEEAQAIMWSIGLLLKARIIPPEEGLARAVCEQVFKHKLDPIGFNDIVTTLRSDGLILGHLLLPGHPSYAEENFLDKDLSIHLTDLKDILKERRRPRELNSLAEAFYLKNSTKEALECFDKALEIDPKLAQAWLCKGVVLGKLGRPPEEKLDCYNKALEIDPKLAQAWLGKGGVLGKLGKYQEALECLDKALKIDPKYALAWYCKGVVLKALGRNEEAEECFKKARELGFWPPE